MTPIFWYSPICTDHEDICNKEVGITEKSSTLLENFESAFFVESKFLKNKKDKKEP